METVQDFLDVGYPYHVAGLLSECVQQQLHPPIIDGNPDLDVRRLAAAVPEVFGEARQGRPDILVEFNEAAEAKSESGAFMPTHFFNQFRLSINRNHMHELQYPWQKRPYWIDAVAKIVYDERERRKFIDSMKYNNSTTVPQRIAGTKLIVASLFSREKLRGLRHVSGGSSLDYTLAMLDCNARFRDISVSEEGMQSEGERSEFEKLIKIHLRRRTGLVDSYGVDLLRLDDEEGVAYAKAGFYPSEHRDKQRRKLLERLEIVRNKSKNITHVSADITTLLEDAEVQQSYPRLQPGRFDSGDLTTMVAQLYPRQQQAALNTIRRLLNEEGVATVTDFVDLAKMGGRTHFEDISEIPFRAPTSAPFSFGEFFCSNGSEDLQLFGMWETGRCRSIQLTDIGKACLKGELVRAR